MPYLAPVHEKPSVVSLAVSHNLNQDAVSINLQMTMRETEHRPSARPSVDALKQNIPTTGRYSRTEITTQKVGLSDQVHAWPTPDGRPEIASRSTALNGDHEKLAVRGPEEGSHAPSVTRNVVPRATGPTCGRPRRGGCQLPSGGSEPSAARPTSSPGYILKYLGR